MLSIYKECFPNMCTYQVCVFLGWVANLFLIQENATFGRPEIRDCKGEAIARVRIPHAQTPQESLSKP